MALVGLPMSAIAANDGAVAADADGGQVTAASAGKMEIAKENADADGVVEVKSNAKTAKVVEHLQNHYKLYGFIRNYMAYDSRESVSGTGDLFYYLPKDVNLNDLGDDLNRADQFRYLSLTTRVGLDVTGYQIKNTAISAKVEADFYAGLSGVTGVAQFRLRQAYMKFAWNNLKMNEKSTANVSLLMGQAWHPMAVDLCPVFSLASGAPFGPFSRTPQVTMEAWLGNHFAITASALWQMQYTSAGPAGSSADYIKYSCTPEAYIGFTAKAGGFMAKTGVDILSIKPRRTGEITYLTEGDLGLPVTKRTNAKVSDRITTFSPFLYMQYVKGKFSVKGKTIFAAAGEHMNIQGGYGITEKFNGVDQDGHYEYTPTYSSSTWVAFSYGKKWQPSLMLGYYENFGTFKDLYTTRSDGKVEEGDFFFSKNSFKNLNRMYRVVPYITYNLGKFTIGLEYELTAAQFGTPEKEEGLLTGTKVLYNSRGLATDGLHWVMNHRVQAMFKFNF